MTPAKMQQLVRTPGVPGYFVDPSRLPAELWFEIIELADDASWLQLALVNRTLRVAAQRMIFDDIDLTDCSLPVAISCLQTLAARPTLARHTRSLSLGRTDPPEFYMRCFWRLVRRAFLNMPNLDKLSVGFFAPLGRYLSGTPFRLSRFVCYCIWDAALLDFLEEQAQLRSFEFFGTHTDRQLNINPNALMNIHHASGSPNILRAVVPGRPVTLAELHFPPWLPFDATSMMEALQAAGRSTGPLQQFSIYIDCDLQNMPPLTLLEALRMTPMQLPCLDSLMIHISGCAIHEVLLEGFGGILGLFEHLRRFEVSSAVGDDLLHQAHLGRDITTVWRAKCKTLRVVYLPSGEWSYQEGLGWQSKRGSDERRWSSRWSYSPG